MSLQLGRAFREGGKWVVGQSGLVVIGLLFVVLLLTQVANQSLTLAIFERVEPLIDRALDSSEVPATAKNGLTTVELALRRGNPLAIDVSLPVAGAMIVAMMFVAEAVHIVAVRAFASSQPGDLPDGIASGLGGATINGFFAGVIANVLVFIGLVLLVVPGIYLAVALVFVRQEVAVEGENFVGAVSASWDRTGGNRLMLFVLGLVLFAVFFGLQFVAITPVAAAIGGTVGAAIGALVQAVLGAFVVAVFTRAYVQLRSPSSSGGGQPRPQASGQTGA